MTRKIVSEMTYNVLMGTLNPTIPYLFVDYGRLFAGSEHHRQRGSDCTVLTATGLVNGEWQILTPYRI